MQHVQTQPCICSFKLLGYLVSNYHKKALKFANFSRRNKYFWKTFVESQISFGIDIKIDINQFKDTTVTI